MRRTVTAALAAVLSIVLIVLALNRQIGHSDDEIRTLNGQWEFYWQKLLEPDEWGAQDAAPSAIRVPGSWRSRNAGLDGLSAFGCGTYRLRFAIPEEAVGTRQALLLHYVGSAYRIWIDGVEHEGLGKVGTSREEEVPRLRQHLIRFTPADETVEIVMQVSNFSFREGGITSGIRWGPDDAVTRGMLVRHLLTMAEIGAALLFGAYHLVLYGLRRTDAALLHIGLIAVCYAARTFMITEYAVHLFFPRLPWEAVIRTEYLIEAGMAALVGLFLRQMFPADIHPARFRLCIAATIAAMVYVAAAPTEVFTSLIHAGIVVVLMLMVMIEISVKAKRRKLADANLYLAGMLIMLLAIVNDTLNYTLTIRTFFVFPYAFMLFMFIQAIIVSNRYQRIHESNAELTKEMLILNSTLEEKIEARTEELRAKNAELEQLHEARAKMLANIAHDIGTPLAGMKTYLQILREDRIPVDRPGVVGMLLDRISYIQRLNQDLLELSKLESRHFRLDLETFQLNAFLLDLLQPFQTDIAEGGRLKVSLGEVETTIDGEEARIRADRVRIMQVVHNFISNAIKYNRAEEKNVTVHCYVRSSPGTAEEHEAVFEFEDNGNGIDPADLPHLFEQFYRKADGIVEGSGLGLAIVKGIIEQHGGEVGARNKPEAGSVFYFTLPASSGARSLHSGS
jgi:Signal transduction histidine kinase